MRVGYACRNHMLPTSSRKITYTNFKKLELKQQIHKLFELTECNLNNLENILIYNVNNNINMFRFTSGIFPIANHPDVIKWWDPMPMFKTKIATIGNIIKNNNMRVSMHLPQFISLTSSDKDIIKHAFYDLEVSTNFLNRLELNYEPDIILHMGGKYNNKKTAIRNLITNFNDLPISCKNKIRFENDHHIYGTQEVYHVCKYLNIPMVLDIAHHKFNSNDISLDTAFNIFFDT